MLRPQLRMASSIVALLLVVGSCLSQQAKEPDRQATKDKAKWAKRVAGNPNDVEARIGLAEAELILGENQSAVSDYEKAIATDPNAWNAHINLVLGYARIGNWTGFDHERALIQAARDRGTSGLRTEGPDFIDEVRVGERTYNVLSYYIPLGPHHTHYLFVRNGDNGKPVEAFTCESDDGDQVAFRQQFPKEAEAGARRYSLDRWIITADGAMQHQPVIALYDGEPPYEHLRSDVVMVVTRLEKQTAEVK